MRSIFESAKGILEKSDATQGQLDALTKVMLSTKHSYSVINAVRDKLNTPAGDVLLGIVSVIAGNTTLFNAFVTEFKKGIGVTEEAQIDEAIPADQVTYFNLARSIKKTGVSNSGNTKFVSGVYVYTLEKKDGMFGSISKIDDKRKVLWTVSLTPVKELNNAPKLVFTGITRDEFIKLKNTGLNEAVELTEEEHAVLMEDRLQSDIKSLKRIGWKLDKVIPFMVTKGSEYGVKMTSDLITMYYNDGGAKKKLAPVKVPKPKKVSWPKDPPASKRNDPQHAEAYLGQVIDSEESPDMTGSEAWEILRQAGYTDHANMWVIKNMGWEGDLTRGQGGTPIAKKTAPKFRK